ncbi:hypothetical protein TAMA11512_24010 [Selenomonas sp. TAMA-11512]|nr:hypothetical protein TAMA11512_24010 [Selenomonas sp. TAMA-11512]
MKQPDGKAALLQCFSRKYITPAGSMAETGHYFPGETAFYLAYRMKFYGGRQWYYPPDGKFKDPNFADRIYALIDEAR